MADRFADFENGDDSNAGTSSLAPWKHIAPNKSLNAGDIIKAVKSDESNLGSCTWTAGSKNITLPSALTAMIFDCNSAMTASSSVTCTTDSSNEKFGTARTKITIAGGFSTGKVAYKDLGSALDLSAYEQISFWAWTDNDGWLEGTEHLEIRLCSDTTGDTAVNTFTIPEMIRNTASLFTLDNGAPLGSSIQSIAIYATSDPGASPIWLDCIIACKAKGGSDTLTLNSIIGKKTAGEPEWYNIKSIDGTTVVIDVWGNDDDQAHYYAGTTESVTTYAVMPFRIDSQNSGSVAHQQTASNGSAGNLITFSGGWDSTFTTRDGITVYDGHNGKMLGLDIDNTYCKFEHVGFTRYTTGVEVAKSYTELEDVHVSGAQAKGIFFKGTAGAPVFGIQVDGACGVCGDGTGFEFDFVVDGVFKNMRAMTNDTEGFTFDTGVARNKFIDCEASGNEKNGLDIGNDFLFNRFKGLTVKRNLDAGFAVPTASPARDMYIIDFVSDNNTEAAISLTGDGYVNLVLYNADISDSTIIDWGASDPSREHQQYGVFSELHGGTSNDHRIYFPSVTVKTNASVVRDSAPFSWEFNTNSSTSEDYKIPFKLGEIYLNSGVEATLSFWFQRASTSAKGEVVLDGIIHRFSDDLDKSITAEVAVDASWHKQDLVFTPSHAGIYRPILYFWGTGTNLKLYFSGVEVSQ